MVEESYYNSVDFKAIFRGRDIFPTVESLKECHFEDHITELPYLEYLIYYLYVYKEKDPKLPELKAYLFKLLDAHYYLD